MKTNKNMKRSLLTTVAFVLAAVAGLLLLSSGGGQADQVTAAAAMDETATPSEASGELWSSSALPALAKMIGALLVVVVCIYVGIYLLKRTMGGRYGGSRGTNALEVIETAVIGQRKSVTLVRVGEKSVLVGVSEDRMAPLSELNAEDTAAILASAPQETEGESFGKMLSAAAGGVRKLASKNRRTALES